MVLFSLLILGSQLFGITTAEAAPLTLKSEDAILDQVLGPDSSGASDIWWNDLHKGEASRDFAKLMARVRDWRKTTTARPKQKDAFHYCASQIKTFQCENSEFKDFTLVDRFDEIMKIVDNRLKTQSELKAYRNAVPCLVSRETDTLEPLAVSLFNCYPDRFASDQGLGQVTLVTFLWALGLNEQEVNQTVETYITKMSFKKSKQKKRRTLLTAERASKLPIITNVAPFNSVEYRRNPMRIYEEMSGSPQFQIDLILRVLALKSARGNSVEDTLVHYNGSKTKLEYGKAVMECKSCLDLGRENITYCLGLAQGRELSRDVKDVTVCN